MWLILPQEVDVRLCGSNIKNYINKGYSIQKRIDKRGRLAVDINKLLTVHVLDLPNSSNVKVKVQCDVCGKILDISYEVYNRYVYNYEYNCHNCISKSNKSSDKTKKFYENLREELINELTCYINKNGYPSSIKKTFTLKNNMHSYRSYVNCFGGDLPVWIEACGFILTKEEKEAMLKRGRPSEISKQDATTIVMKMSKSLGRPLMYDDFRSPNKSNDYLGITIIKKLWGSLNKMKQELNLEIVQENMNDRKITLDEALVQIQTVCNYISAVEGRNFITSKDFGIIKKLQGFENISNYGTLYRMLKNELNISMSEYISSLGFTMGKQGNGILYNFDDGERTLSQFEYMFSRYLREFGLVYNKDYYRDVDYKDFISGYSGNTNCDYVIKYNNRTIHIEIAGIIANYKLWYYDDKPIDYSKSKEKYRLKLKEKEQILKNNNLIYFILFPCDLTRDIFMEILEDSSLDLKHRIEKFMKNNIDWVKIQKLGELKYKENETSRLGQLVVDYTERK